MHLNPSLNQILLFFILNVIVTFAYSTQKNPYRQVANLDKEGRYVLEWTVNWENRSVTFYVNVATTGHIGFGLSSRGDSTANADFVLGGVNASGSPYIIDMHCPPNTEKELVEDKKQNYALHFARENGTHTFLQFSRPFETCDETGQDYTINDDTVVLHWCFGGNDDNHARCHHENSGSFRAHLLNPSWAPREFQVASRGKKVTSSNNDLKVWTLSRRQRVVPNLHTMYWCSYHKGPQLTKKHHLVGFNFRWENEIVYNRTHHIILLRCQAPSGKDPVQFFEPYVQNSTGEMCFFFLRGANGGLPLQYCEEVVYSYAVGAEMYFMPDHVGIPFGYNPHEYYALQVHYDNYDLQHDLEYTVNIDMYYTENLRENEAGIATTGHHIPGSPSILIPPNSSEHHIYGHCGSSCSRAMLPDEGVKIIGVIQHTHLSGRRHRLRHFRNGTELAWIINDDNYSGYFHSMRMLRQEVTWMPGDHLVTRCVYDNSWTNGSVVAGFSTKQEMCVTYIWYYNKLLDHSMCRSEILEKDEYAEKHLGVKELSWSDPNLEYVVTEPENLRGKTVSQLSNHLEWNIQKREELQWDHQFLSQRNICPSLTQLSEGNGEGSGNIVKYPTDVEEYIPEIVDECVQ